MNRPPGRTRAAAGEYERALERFAAGLGSEWTVFERPTRRLAWRVFLAPGAPLPRRGWKIHVSAAAAEGAALVRSTLAFLARERATFKLPAAADDIVALNSGELGEGQAGKVLTVYPRDDAELRRLARGLQQRWPRSRGPEVRTDLLLRPGSAVSIRYGSFEASDALVDARGRHRDALRGPAATLLLDRVANGDEAQQPATPIACCRPSAEDLEGPFEVERRRYVPLATMHRSPKSRVMLALDVEACSTAVLKIARRGMGGDLSGCDAAGRLRNEHRALASLAGRGLAVPRALGLEEGERVRLALEDVGGVRVSSLSRAERLAALPGIARILAELHRLGWVHRDVKLGNVLRTKERLVLVDFEMAARVGSYAGPAGGTLGHAPRLVVDAPADPAEDVYALAACVAHAALGCDPALLAPGRGRVLGLLQLAGAQRAARIVARLSHAEPSRRPSAERAARLLDEPEGSAACRGPAGEPPPRLLRRLARREWSLRAALEAGRATRRFRVPQPDGSSWRNHHLEADFDCEAIALGAAGILLGLMSLERALGRRCFEKDIVQGARWLASRAPTTESHGLFTGDAGVALALAVASRRLGDDSLARAARERLLAGGVEAAELDLYSGAAGRLWAGCLLADVLREEWPLEVSEACARRLIEKARRAQGTPAWETVDGPAPYTGAAHGVAGIALALALWGRRAGCERSRGLALAAFAGLCRAGRTKDGNELRLRLGEEPAARAGTWCHGPTGLLWCLLAGAGKDPELRAAIDWAAHASWNTPHAANPTYCHGLAGQLETWRLLSTVPRHRDEAQRRARRCAAALRLTCQRSERCIVWASDDPRISTPDLWLGFLGPATALALEAAGREDALLSSSWLCEVATSESA